MPPVVLDARRNPATVYENVDVALARQYRDDAKASAEQGGVATARSAALAAGFSTWAELQAFSAKMSVGDRTIVDAADSGTHADPIAGAGTRNGGRYEKQASYTDPVRIGDTDAQVSKAQADSSSASAAAAANAVMAPSKILDGYDTSLLTGDETTGPGPADGSNLGPGVYSVIATPAYDGVWGPTIDFWRRVGSAGNLELGLVRRNANGNWTSVPGSKITVTCPNGTGALTSSNFSLPHLAGDMVLLGLPAGTSMRISADNVATQRFVIGDVTAISDLSPTVANIRPRVTLRGAYSQIKSKGAVKAEIDATPMPSRTGIYNLTKGGTERLRASFADVRAMRRSSRILMLGDSNTRDSHVGTNGSLGSLGYTGAYDKGALALLLPKLRKYHPDGLGLNCGFESVMGYGNIQGEYSLYNPRVQRGDWTTVGTVPYTSIGGGLWKSSTPGGAPWSLTPAVPVDTFELLLIGNPAFGITRYQIDDGAWTIVDQYFATDRFFTVKISVAQGMHKLSVQHLSGGDVYLVGSLAYDASTPAVEFINGGHSGSTAYITYAQVNGRPWNVGALLGTFQYDGAALCLGTNDMDDGISAANFASGMDTLVTLIRRVGDPWFKTPIPARTDSSKAPALMGTGVESPNRTIARQNEFKKVIFELSSDRKVPIVDLAGWFGPPVVAVNERNLLDDHLHKNVAGAEVWAQADLEFFRCVA